MYTAQSALIIGASGQVGQVCANEFARRGYQVNQTDGANPPVTGMTYLDLRDHHAVQQLIGVTKPNVCVLTAALTNVDLCENQPELAKAINSEGPRVVAQACRDIDCPLVYLSTEYVFDGTKGPYSEEDPVSPICVYGQSKLEGEQHVLQASPRNLSLRTTVVYSYHPGGLNFAMQLWNRLGAGERMRVPVDQVSSPTYAPDLAMVIAELVERRAGGIFNVVGPQVMGRYDFAVEVARQLGLPTSLIDPVDTASLNQRAKRPLQAGLKIDKLNGLLGEVMGSVAKSVAHFQQRARAHQSVRSGIDN